MGYGDHLKALLRPLGIYELDEGYGGDELALLGEKLDLVGERLEELERETLAATAQDEGLSRYEELLPYRPKYITTEDRRRAVMALMRVDDCSFTAARLNSTLSGCGIAARVDETETAMTVAVSFPQNRGKPEGIDELKKRIESLLPCHLAVEYCFLYPSWEQLETWFQSFGELEMLELSWEELERYSQ